MTAVEPEWTRPKLVRYRPGPGMPIGMLGLGFIAFGLFGVRWIDGDGGTFRDISRSLRHLGAARVDDAVLYGYGAWGAFTLAAVLAVFVLAAGLPVPSTSGGNTYARVAGAAVAGAAAIVHTVFLGDLFGGPMSPQLGAWLTLVGYLLAGAGIALGARRISATY